MDCEGDHDVPHLTPASQDFHGRVGGFQGCDDILGAHHHQGWGGDVVHCIEDADMQIEVRAKLQSLGW